MQPILSNYTASITELNYFLDFHPKALKEWKNLNQSIKLQFHKKLKDM